MATSKAGGKRPGAGRPVSLVKKESDRLTIRADKDDLEKLRTKYGKGVNKLLKSFIKELVYDL